MAGGQDESGRLRAPICVVDRRPDRQPGKPRLVLFLDDDPARADAAYVKARRDADTYVWVTTAAGAIRELEGSMAFDLISLDHDLVPDHYTAYLLKRPIPPDAPPTGMAVARWLTENYKGQASIRVHSMNETAGKAMTILMQCAGLKAYYAPWGTW